LRSETHAEIKAANLAPTDKLFGTLDAGTVAKGI
jgi:hypothetical protein